MERIVVAVGGEPDVLHAVFPVCPCAPPLLPLPGDAVSHMEEIAQHISDDQAGLPVAADIDGAVLLQKRLNGAQPLAGVSLVVLLCFPGKLRAVEGLREVVRRIRDDQIHAPLGQKGADLEHISTDGAVQNGVEVSLLFRDRDAALQIGAPLAQRRVDGLVPPGLSLRHTLLLHARLPLRRAPSFPCFPNCRQSGSVCQCNFKDWKRRGLGREASLRKKMRTRAPGRLTRIV